MLPSRHIVTSLMLQAGVWYFTGSAASGVLCFLSGILPDFDHIIEYGINYGFKDFTIKKLYGMYETFKEQKEKVWIKKIYLIFHSLEVAILLWIASIYSKNIYLTSAALGYSVHLALDFIENKEFTPYLYFSAWRLKNNFQTQKLLRDC